MIGLVWTVVLSVVCSVALGACSLGGGGGDDDGGDDCALGREPIDPDGTLTRYAVDTLDLPGSSEEVTALALNIDGEGPTDNRLGQITSLIAQFDYDLDAEAKMLIDAGALLHLFEAQATSLVEANGVRMRIGLGMDLDADPTDNFSGDEPLAYDPNLGFGDVTGTIFNGQLDLRLGNARIGVALPGIPDPFVFPLIRAQAVGTISATGLEGRIGGGIPVEFVDSTLVPVLYEGLLNVIDRDCPGGVCEPGSSGQLLIDVFDANDDGTMSVTEFRDSSITQSLLQPDLDVLIAGTGELRGPCDAEDGNDALSVGIGFHAVRARIN
jgi:hypothetical protein